MIRWVGDGRVSPDVHADVCLRINSALSERRGSEIVGEWRSCVVVQERIPFPCKANGHHSLVPTAGIAMNLRDKMYELKKKTSAQ
jgi:hypothetical protein